MNLNQRLKKLESETLDAPCFCNKTLVDLWYRGVSADALTYCPNCKETFDHWKRIAAEATGGENLTDFVEDSK